MCGFRKGSTAVPEEQSVRVSYNLTLHQRHRCFGALGVKPQRNRLSRIVLIPVGQPLIRVVAQRLQGLGAFATLEIGFCACSFDGSF